jgi:hypothetical protein
VTLIDRFDRDHESIAAAFQRLDVVRRLGRIPQGASELGDADVQAVFDIDEHVVRPQGFSQLVARDELTRALDEQREDLKRLVL